MPEGRDFLPRLRGLYEGYLDTVTELERNRKPVEGIFGMKGGPKDDPCHDRFTAEVEACLGEFSRSGPSSAEIREVLSYMYTVPLSHREPQSAYWMLVAVQGLTLSLIDGLSPADAGALRERFGRDYPRWERLPAQKKLFTALKK